MFNNASSLPSGLSVKPAQTADKPFLETLYRSARGDIDAMQGDRDLVQSVHELQYRVLNEGAGNAYPNAMHFVVEKTQERIGGLIVDFGHNEVRIVYLALVPAMRGQGLGKTVIQGIQQAAASAGAPVAVTVWHNNALAKRTYLALGFTVESSTPAADRMVWNPGRKPSVVVAA